MEEIDGELGRRDYGRLRALVVWRREGGSLLVLSLVGERVYASLFSMGQQAEKEGGRRQEEGRRVVNVLYYYAIPPSLLLPR